MNKKAKSPSLDHADLRRRAEEHLADQDSRIDLSLTEADTRRLLHELQVHQVELELQNEELRQARDSLEEARDQYRDLYDRAPAGYLSLDEKGIIRQANQTMARMLSTERARLDGQSLHRFLPQEQRGALLRHLNSVAETGTQQNLETDLVKKGGTTFTAQLEISTLFNEGESARIFRVVVVDISRLKVAQNQLSQANERLEEEVRIRTLDLVASNKALEEEIKQHKEAARELSQQKVELEFKTKELERANIAVGVLLRRSEQDRQAMEDNIMQQINSLVVPCLKNLLSNGLNPGQQLGIETALAHVDHITSAFAKKLGSPNLGLTAREIEISGMINRGLSSKEIADSLNLSPDTVSFHRRNIRRKLGITDSDTSLSMHLRNFE